ncbi:unnamed protein product, partial [Amoebophrya sp. A25]
RKFKILPLVDFRVTVQPAKSESLNATDFPTSLPASAATFLYTLLKPVSISGEYSRPTSFVPFKY